MHKHKTRKLSLVFFIIMQNQEQCNSDSLIDTSKIFLPLMAATVGNFTSGPD